MRWRIYSSVFITPPRTVTKLTDNRWKTFNFKGWGKENLKAQFLESETKSKDVILYLHGYDSTLGRGESRCQHMNSMGLNVLSLDQRGFGEQKGKYEWTILKVVADIELLLAPVGPIESNAFPTTLIPNKFVDIYKPVVESFKKVMEGTLELPSKN